MFRPPQRQQGASVRLQGAPLREQGAPHPTTTQQRRSSKTSGPSSKPSLARMFGGAPAPAAVAAKPFSARPSQRLAVTTAAAGAPRAQDPPEVTATAATAAAGKAGLRSKPSGVAAGVTGPVRRLSSKASGRSRKKAQQGQQKQQQQQQKVRLEALACEEECCAVCGSDIKGGEAFVSLSLKLPSRLYEKYEKLQQRHQQLERKKRAGADVRTGAAAGDCCTHVLCHVSCLHCGACGIPLNAVPGGFLFEATAAAAAAAAGAAPGEAVSCGTFHAACKEQHCAVCHEALRPSEAFIRLPRPSAVAAGAAATEGNSVVQHSRCTRCSSCGNTLETGPFLVDGGGCPHHSNCFCCCCCGAPLTGAFEAHAYFSVQLLLQQLPPLTSQQVDAAAAAAAAATAEAAATGGTVATHGGCCCISCSHKNPKCVCCDRRAGVYIHPGVAGRTLPRAVNAAGAELMRSRGKPFTACKSLAAATAARVASSAATRGGDDAAVLCGRCAALPSVETPGAAASALQHTLAVLDAEGVSFSEPMKQLQQRMLELDEQLQQQQQQKLKQKGFRPLGLKGPAAVPKETRVSLPGLPIPIVLTDFGFSTAAVAATAAPLAAAGGRKKSSVDSSGAGGCHLFGCCEVLQLRIDLPTAELCLAVSEACGIVVPTCLQTHHHQQQKQLNTQQRQLQRAIKPLSASPELDLKTRCAYSPSTRRATNGVQHSKQQQLLQLGLQVRFAKRVHLIRGLPAVLLQQHAAHELAHAYFAIKQLSFSSQQTEEGWCNVAASRTLAALLKQCSSSTSSNCSSGSCNREKEMEQKLAEEVLRYQLWKLAVSKDKAYGEGYRRCVRQLRGGETLGQALEGMPRSNRVFS